MNEIMMALVVASSIWVHLDARKIGARKGLVSGLADLNPAGWLVACLFLWIVAVPLYLIKRPALKQAAGGAA